MTLWCPVSLKLTQRASLGKYSARAFFTPSHDHITGAVFRGALARAYIDRHGVPSQANGRRVFQDLFDGATRFGPLAVSGVAMTAQSVRRCKYHQAGAPHPVEVDLAFDPAPEWCPAGSATVASSVDMTSATATAIDPETRTVAEGQLFARQAHRARQLFTGWVVAPDQETVNRLATITRVVVGARGSVMGSAVVEWDAPAETPMPNSLDRVVLRTMSPTFLTDDSGRPTMDAVPAFEKALDQNLAGQVWTGRELLDATGGWHAASGLPKPREIGLDAGITVVAVNPSPDKLKTLLDRGLGLRRSEGFGWIGLAEPLASQAEISASSVVEEADELALSALDGLDRDRRRWLGQKLRTIRAGDRGAVDRALREAGAAGLSNQQRDAVTSLLFDTPDHDRARVAHTLRGTDA